MKRRAFLASAGAALAAASTSVRAQRAAGVADLAPLIAAVTGGAAAQQGGIEVELPALAENDNSVPLAIRVPSPMTPEDHVVAIHVFAERNPRPRIAVFRLGPLAGRAEIDTRVRLAGSQPVTVLVALSGDRFRLARFDVHVTAAACLDESFPGT